MINWNQTELANCDHPVSLPITKARELSVRTGDVHPFRASEIVLSSQPTIRTHGDVKPQRTIAQSQQVKPQKVRPQQTYRKQVLSAFPRIEYARQAMKKNLATLSQKL